MSEEDHLVQADRHIAEAEKRIADQEERLRTALEGGVVFEEGERLLRNLRFTLHEMHVHRKLIVEALQRADR